MQNNLNCGSMNLRGCILALHLLLKMWAFIIASSSSVCNYFLFLGSLTRSLYLLGKYTYVNVVYMYASKIMYTYACIGVTWLSVCWLWVKKILGRESPYVEAFRFVG